MRPLGRAHDIRRRQKKTDTAKKFIARFVHSSLARSRLKLLVCGFKSKLRGAGLNLRLGDRLDDFPVGGKLIDLIMASDYLLVTA
jgi:hypothetical protein